MSSEQGAGPRIVVVGGSLAGVRACETLRRDGFSGDVVLVGAEQHYPPVDRPPLSKKALAGDAPLDRVRVAPDLDVERVLGRSATRLDVAAHEVHLDDDRILAYDGLVIATGARPRVLPDTADRTNVLVLRSADDALRLRSALAPGVRVAVVGAGVLGCEIAATCRGLGLDVTLVDVAPEPMLRVLGPDLAPVLATLHAERGVRLRLGRQVLGLRGAPDVDGVLLDSDEIVPADVVVVAVGAVPETGWLEGSGLKLVDGVLCDEFCFATGTDRSVTAAGDVARWHHPLLGRDLRVEHWTNAVSQAQAAAGNLARHLAGGPEAAEPYAVLPYVWSDQYDWKLQLIGTLGEETTVEEGSIDDGRFVVSYRSEGRLVGALCVNWPNRVPRWRPQIVAALSEWRESE